jgi:pimeloyl-ACP methyl ester carboxylesterase
VVLVITGEADCIFVKIPSTQMLSGLPHSGRNIMRVGGKCFLQRSGKIFSSVALGLILLCEYVLGGGTVTVELVSPPVIVCPGQLANIPVRIRFDGDDNDGPWQVITLALRDDDIWPAFNTIVSVSNPFFINSQGVWYNYTFNNVNLSAYDDGGDGVELYVWGEVNDNDFNGYNPDGSSAFTRVAVGGTPATPASPTPANGSTITASPAKLDWADSARATSYDVYLNGTFRGNVAISEWTLSQSLATGTHNWYVIAKNSCNTATGPNWSFTISCPRPGTPSNPNPADGATGVGTSPTLSWTASNANSHDVYFGSSSPPPFVGNTSNNSWQLAGLQQGRTYYWKITARNSCGTTEGPIWDFTTTCPTPNSPSGPNPTDGANLTSSPNKLDWVDTPGAGSYDVYLDSVFRGTVFASEWALNQSLAVGDHSWQVIARNSCGSTPGATWTFSIEDALFPVITVFSVNPSSVDVGEAFTISWTVSDSGGSGLNRVELWRARDANGTPGNWSEIARTDVSGNGPVSSSFFDSPPSAGTYWYGLHVVDNANNDTVEPNPPGPRRAVVAFPLGSMNQTKLVFGAGINFATDVNLFSFRVAAGQRISFDVDLESGSSLDSYLRLFDSNGNPLPGISTSDDDAGMGEVEDFESYLEYFFASAGKYYVGISSYPNDSYNPLTGSGRTPGDTTGAYQLVVSPGLSGTILDPADLLNHPVDILRLGSVPMAINPSQPTWVVVHGRESSRSEANINGLAQALADANPSHQVLTLDWSDAAADIATQSEDAIINVARWASAALTQYGFAGTSLNFAGHSWGAYVSAETAERIAGGVGIIIAFDPAANGAGTYNPNDAGQIDFAGNSQYSLAFHTSFYGSEGTPTTADECFVTPHEHECFPFCDIPAHSYPLRLFTFMLGSQNGGVSRFFQMGRILRHETGPWDADHYTSHEGDEGSGEPGYEGIIYADADGESPESITYVCDISGQEISVPESGETISPTVSAFSVNSPAGSDFTISWTVSDCGGSTLSRVELWRAPDAGGNPGTWAQIETRTLTGDGPASGVFLDAPPSGSYWYGIHVVDGVGNLGAEPNPPGPIRVSALRPNLAPFQPIGWSDKIVASVSTGSHIDSLPIYDDQDIYVDWSVVNGSTINIVETFSTQLLVDGQVRAIWSTSGLAGNSVTALDDYALGRLSAGNHTLAIRTDSGGTVSESNENDNSYTKTIAVTVRPDTVRPSVAIMSPTSNSEFYTEEDVLNMSGTASDNVAVNQVTWSTDRGGGGLANGTENWLISSVSLLPGDNLITVVAYDAAGNSRSAELLVTRGRPALTALLSGNQLVLSWSANWGGFSLESADALSGGLWFPVSETPSLSDQRYSVMVSTSDGRRFFRLRK